MKAAAQDTATRPGSFSQINNVTFGGESVAWNLASVSGSGATHETPNLKTLIKAVIDRPGWASGNNILIAAFDNGSSSYFRPQQGSGSNPITLTVDYLT